MQWPKALRVSEWVIRLFRLLTLDNRSAIVADVISEKGSMVSYTFLINFVKLLTWLFFISAYGKIHSSNNTPLDSSRPSIHFTDDSRPAASKVRDNIIICASIVYIVKASVID